ncbi:hypothetical protein MVEN_00072800 [Mycena venus]|uniref:Uncharacterized protein n=1 Tax=Mycena venus TaxID=2733690 RepID=A0A8H6Z7Q7_9AGAR|nr:hypothetical protein MVEN_00072800 [Mycena venus]
MEGRNIWDEYASFNPSQGGPSLPSSYGSTIDHSYIGLSEGGTSCTSPSSMGSLQGLPSSSGSFTGKKTARSEAERREALEADEWTLQVKPLQVVCRGCGRTIKLDRRSRYYPGLWEKHRNKCKHVREMQETMETEVCVLIGEIMEYVVDRASYAQKPIPAKVSADDARPLMGGAPSSFPCGGSNPTILAPRRSYYRKI